jgi:hypothetical protein
MLHAGSFVPALNFSSESQAMLHRVAWRPRPFSDGQRSLRAGSRERRAETFALTEARTEIFFPELELIASYPDYIGSARVGQVTLPGVVGCGNK